MGLTVIIIIAVVFIAIIASRKKEQDSLTSTFAAQEENKAKMKKLLQEYVRIGHEALTSLEMTEAEKQDLMGKIIDSLREEAPADEKDLMFHIIRKSYVTLLDKFSFDKEFCSELSKHSMDFEDGIKNNTIQSYGWHEIIAMVEVEKKKVLNMDTSDSSEGAISISFAVKGLQYRDEEAIDAAYELEEGELLKLEEEPDNEYDPFAVKVLTIDGHHIGYVEASKAKRISNNMNRLTECKVKKLSEYDELFIYGLAYFE